VEEVVAAVEEPRGRAARVARALAVGDGEPELHRPGGRGANEPALDVVLREHRVDQRALDGKLPGVWDRLLAEEVVLEPPAADLQPGQDRVGNLGLLDLEGGGVAV